MNGHFDLGRSLMLIGLLLLAPGFAVSFLGGWGSAAFPVTSGGKAGFTLYFLPQLRLLLSLFLTLVFWLLRRR